MSQVNSGYARKKNDLYPTPSWVTHALLPHLPRERIKLVWEPACGDGRMVQAIEATWSEVYVCGTDIEPLDDRFRCRDFLSRLSLPPYIDIATTDAIITNPPYETAQKFIEQSLGVCPNAIVAMLLRVDFDSAKTRRHLFADNPSWCKKVVLTKRIRWFEGPASPSENHAWFIWDPKHNGPATIAYAGEVVTALLRDKEVRS